MKPIIVYDIEKYDNDENVLLINKDKFEKLLEDTYMAGYNDSVKENKSNLLYPNNTRGFKPDYTYVPEFSPNCKSE